MIRLAYTYFLIKALFGYSFPKTRRAIQAARKRVARSKAIGRVS